MNYLKKDSHGCPYLLLAPMEGVGDRTFRLSMREVGGFDEAVTEFIRVPANAHVKSLAACYESKELDPIPLAAQVMGSDIRLLADMAKELEMRGAPRIDFNCGCPSNTVTGKGAGSSLLKEPKHLFDCAQALVQAVSIPVTLKMRSGFEDTSLFKENLLAAQESGICYLTLHPRTKKEGYGPPANWDLIAEAKALLSIPIVGNGDILAVDDALRMLQHTSCDALMIGRGAVRNPFIFHEIRAHFAKRNVRFDASALKEHVSFFKNALPETMLEKSKISKMKQLLNFVFRAKELEPYRQTMLTNKSQDVESFVTAALEAIH